MRTNRFIVNATKAYEKYREREEVWRSLEAIMTLLVVVFLSLFAISPTVKAITDLLAEIKNKEELSQTMRSKIDQLINAQVTFSNVQERIFLLDQYLPETPRMALGITQLVGMARQNNLEVNKISLGQFDFVKMEPERKKDELEESVNVPLEGVNFSMELKGSYPDIKSFSSSIYKIRRGIKVAIYYLEITEKENEKNSNLLMARISGELLFYKEKH